MNDLRYVVLRHEGVPEPHFDVMFETSPGSPLTTFRSDTWPVIAESKLTRIQDHRRAYLEFEGEISNNRGHVTRVASGMCSVARAVPDFIEVHLDAGTELVVERISHREH